MKTKILRILIIGLAMSCSTTKTSIITTENYNQEKNITTLTLIPNGNIDIPGQWTKTNYNEVSKQHFFKDNESTSIAITKNSQKKYPFYSENISDKDFTRKFLEWEKDYYEKKGIEINEIKSGENYIIWKAKGNKVNTIFLYGTKNKSAYNFAVLTDNWTENNRIEFLMELFKKN